MTNCSRARGYAGGRYPFLTQKERDVETGLDYFLARYYSSTQGRFVSPDEFIGGPDELFVAVAGGNPTFYADLTNPQSLNKYQYCFNNPVNRVDHDGHDPVTIDSPWGRALQGAAITGGITLAHDGRLRGKYELAASQLKGAAAREARKALQQQIRQELTPFGRELSRVLESSSSRAGQAARHTTESAARTNPFWNKFGVVSKTAGRGVVAAGVVFSVYNVATAPTGQRSETVGAEIGAWGGAAAGGTGGAKVGAVVGGFFAGPPGAAVGAAVGTVAGGAGGAIVGSRAGREAVRNPPPLSITVKPSILFLK